MEKLALTGRDYDRAEQKVLSQINEHPKFAVEIADAVCLTTGRVNEIILGLQSRGYPIAGDDIYWGYFIGNQAMLEMTAKLLEDRLPTIHLAIRYLKGDTKAPQDPCSN